MPRQKRFHQQLDFRFHSRRLVLLGLFTLSTFTTVHSLLKAGELTVTVIDDSTELPLACRVYLQDEAEEWHFVSSALPEGSALPYFEQWIPMPESVERHTTVSAHPFRVSLPPGNYELTIERGKSYRSVTERLVISDTPIAHTVRLRQWIDPVARGWYAGETHVHRRLHELPNVMQAEELHVTFPVTFWTISDQAAPDLRPSSLRSQGPSPFGDREDRGSDPIRLDETHVIFPRNTEYEIFSVGNQNHTLGALFVLNHQTRFELTAPPIAPIAARAHQEGALLDLDKHSWPWSLMLVPIAGVDLFELSNNSVWRTNFGFRQLPTTLPSWTEFESDEPGTLTEWGWLQYGFEIYYGLLDCGFRIAPTAGTASGVHPVPLGHSRVYVQVAEPFSGEAWIEGLRKGNSFVTTGPMLFATVDQKVAGSELQLAAGKSDVRLRVESVSELPIEQIELIRNGRVIEQLSGESSLTDSGAHRVLIDQALTFDSTGWIAIRTWQRQPDGRRRFAHSAPWYVTVEGSAFTPRRAAAMHFAELMAGEIERNRGVISAEALSEFERALEIYTDIAARGR